MENRRKSEYNLEMPTINSLKAKRNRLRSGINRSHTYCNTIDDSTSLEELETRLETVKSYWGQYTEVEDELCELEQDKNKNTEAEDGETIEQYEAKYLYIYSSLLKAIRGKTPHSEVTDNTLENLTGQQNKFLAQLGSLVPKENDVALPKIIIPKFDGEYSKWATFRDLFLGSVDGKTNLTKTQKFYYLISFLDGEALDLIKNIPMSEDHYLEAWDKLESRFDRPHLCAYSYIKSFLKLPSISTTSNKSLRKIIDGADECLRGLKATGMDSRDPWLIYILLSKLDSGTRLQWSEEVGSNSDVTIYKFLEFLERIYTYTESNEIVGSTSTGKTSSVRSNVARASTISCTKCKQQHYLFQCADFKNLNIENRRQFVKEKSICFNCLKTGHNASNCNSKYRCRTCNNRHHTLVHHVPQNSSNSTPELQASNTLNRDLVHPNRNFLQSNMSLGKSNFTPRDPSNAHNYSENHCEIPGTSHQSTNGLIASKLLSNHIFSTHTPQVVLPTAIVRIKDRFGNFVKIRTLIDSGSQVSFLTETCVQLLGIKRTNARLSITGIASSNAGVTKGQVKVNVYSLFNSDVISVNAYILNRITADIPNYNFFESNKTIISDLRRADQNFNVAGPVDLLLGADVVWSIFKNGKINLNPPGLSAINSIFGWIISGQVNTPVGDTTLISYTVSTNIDEMLQKFWDIEQCPAEKGNLHSENDDPAQIHFRSTYSNALDGKYIVELPFKSSNPKFENTLTGAISRLRTMEKRFNTNSELKTLYTNFMADYELLGHMEMIPDYDIDKQPQYYLPHHAVFKPNSSTTKLRVVFDGSFKDAAGQSLNDTLLIGPPIQRDLFGVSIRFRKFRYVFTADITKMFRQIWVSKNDRDYQRIVWRSDPQSPIKHYRLCTVTYGTSCAPFLSVRVLQQLAIDNESKFPVAASIILNNIYVDDVMTGAEFQEDLQQAKEELVALLESGGFVLRKWSSNSSQFLQKIPTEYLESCKTNYDSLSDPHIKLLGLHWNPISDTYSFRVTNTSSSGSITKRIILSDTASIFDIFGFLAPSTILMKILLQRLWLMKISWDDPIPDQIAQEWIRLKDSIIYFENICIPRNLHILSDFEIHCFCDASSLAYAAVIYCVSRQNGSNNIIAAKTKVAPIKVLSMPRMELCAATLLCRLYNSVKSSLNIQTTNVYAWTDSQIVLHWLSSPPRTWKIFVSHRSEEILSTIPRKFWNYVNTKDNPADCASRGLYPQELLNYDLWWKGPQWLRFPETEWPRTNFKFNDDIGEVKSEKRKVVLTAVADEVSVLLKLAEKTSNWYRLLRIIVYIQRFINRTTNVSFISYREIINARTKLLVCLQKSTFPETISWLQENRTFPNNKNIIKLSPFLDNDGLLRVGGRIQESMVPYNIKHPIIIPNGRIAELIIQDLHIKHLHVGASELFTILRQQFWVFGARNIVRSIVFKCKRCFMLRRQTSQQLMANLPMERVQQYRPFFNTGCDFAGPVTIKMTNCKRPRVCKAYIALFICMSTKALHLELVSDLSSESFIGAFKRLTSRRGKCCNLYSDNGTNFHGARRLLTEMHQMLLDETINPDIRASLTKDGTTWHFIPPSSPHFGGIWESNVKSVKLHLKRVVGGTILTYEEMYTLLTQIEAILNSRPLCSISDQDLNPLTPSHFIIGEPHTSVPEPNYLSTPLPRLKHWKLLQQMVQGFWKRWSSEYITSLQQRPKWQRQQRNYAVGDIVILKEPNIPQTKWLLGRVIQVHPGNDNKVRVVTIKTEKNTYTRPITKIALLPSN